MKWLHSRIARSPRLVLAVGKALLLAGAVLVLSAVFVRGGWLAASWIVPEGPVGYTIAAVLVLAGLAATVLAEKVQKEDKARRGVWW
ncbi:MAG TPA: hypothetical protein VHL79_06300 [Ramlibacter sp.]|jgi:hypothetical protein|nr:hypothetical protein [Ramlibacter sp.]